MGRIPVPARAEAVGVEDVADEVDPLGVMAAEGGGNVTIAPSIAVSVSMPAGARPEDGRVFGAEIARAVEAQVIGVLVKQRRAGGLLS